MINMKWEVLATSKQDTMFIARIGVLCLAVIGASFQALGSLFESSEMRSTLAMVGGFMIAAVPFISNKYLNETKVERRVNSRLMAELVKAEVYKSFARVGDYDKDSDGRSRVFDAEYENIVQKVQPSKQILDEMTFSNYDTSDDKRKLIHEVEQCSSNKEFYMDKRVNGQIDWLHKRSSSFYKRAQMYKGLESVLSFLSGGIGISAGYLGMEVQFGVWVSFFTTAATAVAVHTQTMQHEARAAKVR